MYIIRASSSKLYLKEGSKVPEINQVEEREIGKKAMSVSLEEHHAFVESFKNKYLTEDKNKAHRFSDKWKAIQVIQNLHALCALSIHFTTELLQNW